MEDSVKKIMNDSISKILLADLVIISREKPSVETYGDIQHFLDENSSNQTAGK